ncbi:MAG: bifunctional phosphoribosylaminoimidazolecarboxamide formyltransferase/IMP cyclohydrolase [Chloroflexi bacterium]|nr:bifunctional phosphoribosylaminoimidazolecarboxamide formyltransferase/IMP cyclohydrolase [Chloroflexota bacterium]
MKRALLSCSDKTGLADLARVLQAHEFELIASGGTAAAIQQAGLPVRTVESLTGFPEMIGGRVKTLHPAVHAGILARRTPEHLAELQAHALAPIDLVVANLYPFQATVSKSGTTFDEAVEQIDIGGVTLIRAAAKNFEWVTIVCEPSDYAAVAAEIERAGETTRATRAALALKAFRHTASYDAVIAQYLVGQIANLSSEFPATLTLPLEKVTDLRYGENPHQHAALYRGINQVGLAEARHLHGKPLSFTNWLDVEAAWRAANSFAEPAAVIIKHVTPCGIASDKSLSRAYLDARECDPSSAFGGVVGLNRSVDVGTARAIAEIFTEVIIAPRFDDAACEILQKKKDLRLLEFAPASVGAWELRTVGGSYLLQDADDAAALEWRVVSQRAPTPEEERALRFAWRAVKLVKSNAIVLARDTRTVGIGAGQMSRVESVKIAVDKAGEKARGAVLASDAYFPFADGVEAACNAGVTAIAETGGSLRDQEAIEMANRFNVAMVFTGTRHFRH